MREVVDGVFELPLGFVNVHLVVTDDGVVLVDTGPPRRSPHVERALRRIGRTVADLRTILLTHYHFDHTGNVADLRTRSGAEVVAHAADAPVVSGATREPPTGWQARLTRKLFGTAEPTKLDRIVTAAESEPVPGFTAIHTPGHSRGHVSYLLDRAGGVLFAGDVAGGRNGTVGRGPAVAGADQEELRRSVAKLASFDFGHAVFGHGRAVTGGAAERFREYAAGAAGGSTAAG